MRVCELRERLADVPDDAEVVFERDPPGREGFLLEVASCAYGYSASRYGEPQRVLRLFDGGKW